MTQHPGVVELIHAHAAARPTATALRTPAGAVTYADLWARAGLAAKALTDRGVRPGDTVVVRMPSGPRAIVAMLGSWLAGAAFVPVDMATPAERLVHVIGHSGAVVVLDGDTALEPSTGHLPAASTAAGTRPVGAGADAPLDDRGAYVVYTSGSTGVPKGVLVGHRALAGHVRASVDLFALGPHSTVLQFASLGFDVAQEEIWPTLAAGATLAFHGTGSVPDTARLASVAAALEVTVLQLPTAYWRMLCAELDGADGPSFAGVRTVVIGGENATTADARAHRRTPLAHTVLVNGYGPTETVITATALVLAPGDDVPATAGLPIGRPVGERVARVLDEERRPVADGEPGELWIGGELLATGYLHDEARTRDQFPPDPYAAAPGARMYRTGDMVVRREDGGIEFLGRVDNQVKVRGHRIELDEVDRHLLDVPGIVSATAFTLDDGAGGNVLAAAVAGDGSGPDPRAVREHLRERIPAYLVPGRIAVLDRLPLTTSGKTDRRAAAKAAAAVLATGATPVPDGSGPPRSPLDAVLALLRSLLLAPEFGPDDDFLAQGGDSLMALRVCARMRGRGISMNPGDLLAGRTARAAVALAERRRAPRTAEEEPAGPLDLLPAQHRWLRDGDLPERDHFCLNALFTTGSGLSARRLAQAAGALQRRHPALRTALREDGTAELAQTDPADAVRVLDLGPVLPRDRTAVLEDALAAAQTSMSLERGRVLQLLYADGVDGDARLLLTVHHFVLDGVSMSVLVDDLELLLADGRPEAAATGPRAIGAALRDWVRTPQARADAAEWAARTTRFTALRPDADGAARLPTLRTHRFRLPADLTRQVTHRLPAAGVFPHHFALGCLVGGLAAWTGEPVHGVDVYAHSRDVSPGDLDLSRTVGYVQSTYPAVLRWEGKGMAALVEALEGPAALPERRYGFDALRFLSPDPGERAALAACPRPRVRLNFRGHLLRLEQRSSGAVLRPASESFGAHRSPLQQERYLLMAEGDIVDGRLEMSLKYSTVHWSAERIEELAGCVDRVMRQTLDDSGDASRAPAGPPRPHTAPLADGGAE
ncbi:amino acid adenylation domain-containing protein [Streptomyces sp. NBC_00704]|uniref:amino acid adenylation domain-containing protein n=1 Tax=Streptomyces sp. NBC_00704 TaxID=2975809 RepID=UPI002E2FD518|nr:amino acid adenylation domain-containing protein [Streptomyces sp. NBC_00704]